MIRCVNPSCFQGDPGNPPEYVSDNEAICGRCLEPFDLDNDEHTEDDAGYVCESCRWHCEDCGEPCGDYESECDGLWVGRECYCHYCMAWELTAGLEAA